MLHALTLAAVVAIVTPPSSGPALPRPEASAAVATLRPDGERARKSDETGELVRLTTRDKVELEATYFAPRSSKGVAPGALLVHEAGADRHTLDEMAENLRKRGFGVLSVDLRGHGGSVSEAIDWRTLDEAARKTTWALAGRDLEAALDNLRDRKEIHSANLTLVGVGAGGNLALRHARDDNQVRAVVLVGPHQDAYGMDTADGIADLGGLPCMILASKAERDLVDGLAEVARNANDGNEVVAVTMLTSNPEDVLADKRLFTALTKWLGDTVQEKGKK